MHSAGGNRVVRAVCQRLEASSGARVWYCDSSRDDGDRGRLHGHLVRHDAIISSYEAVCGLIVGAATPLRHPLRVAFMASERQPPPRPRRHRPTCERYQHLDRAGRPSPPRLRRHRTPQPDFRISVWQSPSRAIASATKCRSDGWMWDKWYARSLALAPADESFGTKQSPGMTLRETSGP